MAALPVRSSSTIYTQRQFAHLVTPAPFSRRSGQSCGYSPRLSRFSSSIVEQKVPAFGAESITEGTILEFKAKVGEAVAKGDIIAVIETDKVAAEVVAQEAGVIVEILAKVDDNVEVGQTLVKIDIAGTAASESAGTPSVTESAPSKAATLDLQVVDQKITELGGESITEGTLMEWRKHVGESVSKGDIIAVVETDKVAVEIAAVETGVIAEVLAKAEDTVVVGAVIAKIQAGGMQTQPSSAIPAPQASIEATGKAAQPSVHDIPPPGKGLRAEFARRAALRAAGLPMTASIASSTGHESPVPKQILTPAAAPAKTGTVTKDSRAEHRIPMTPIRQRVVQRMKQTQDTMAMLTTFQEADMTAVLEMRTKYKDSFQKTHGAQLGLLSIFVKASSDALKEVPGVNALTDDATKEIVYRDYADICVPIPTPRGPVSCVLRNVETMSILDIEKTLASMSQKARQDELAIEDMASPSFGIVDAGSVGGMLGTSMINPPQSAVLGTNEVKQRACVVGGKVVARPIMYLSLTYDHRLVDGREAVSFLCSVRDKMEDPTRMLLNM